MYHFLRNYYHFRYKHYSFPHFNIGPCGRGFELSWRQKKKAIGTCHNSICEWDPPSDKVGTPHLLRCVDTSLGSPELKLPVGAKISGSKSLTILHAQIHMPLWACGSFSDHQTSPPELPAADLEAYVLGFLIQHLHYFLFFVKVRHH